MMSNKNPKRGLLAAAVCAGLVGQALPSIAQSNLSEEQLDIGARAARKKLGFTHGSFIAAPIPFSNPTFGTGLALGAGYLFRNAANTDTSMIGVAGMKTDTGSIGYGIAANIVLPNNRWRFGLLAGKVELKYDLGTIKLPVEQSGRLVRLELAFGITHDISFGGVVRYLDTDISGNLGLLPELKRDISLSLLQFSATAGRDTRDSDIYPTNGSRLQAQASYGYTVDGRFRDYTQATLLYSIYRPVGRRSLIAAQGALCSASDDAPFFEQCLLGGFDAFRGFPVLEYFDQQLASAQIAFRSQLGHRLGWVAFAGVGAVAPELGNLNSDDVHTAAGVGIRLRLSRKFPVDFSIDVSLNDEGQQLTYVYVGQRF